MDLGRRLQQHSILLEFEVSFRGQAVMLYAYVEGLGQLHLRIGPAQPCESRTPEIGQPVTGRRKDKLQATAPPG